MPLPPLTPEQRAAALEEAAQARTAHTQARAQLRSGELSLIEVLCAPHDSPAGDLRVEQLLVSLPGIGKPGRTPCWLPPAFHPPGGWDWETLPRREALRVWAEEVLVGC